MALKFRTLHELAPAEAPVTLIASSGRHQHDEHVRKGNLILVPQPSEDPNDPLRWPKWKKHAAFASICALAFLSSCSVGGLSPAFYLLSQEFKTDISKVTGLLTWPTLTFGLGNFIWVPLATHLGRRPVFLLASLILFAANLWAALSSDFPSLLGSRAVAGFAGGSTEALGAVIVNEIYFLHERGQKMGFYIVALATGNALGPLAGGFIVTNIGWRWVIWIAFICTGVDLLAIFLCFSETQFARYSNANIASEANMSNKSDLREIEIESAENLEAADQGRAQKKKSYLAQLKPWSGRTKNDNLLGNFVRSFPVILYPAIFWVFLSYSISLAASIASGALSSFVYQAPPYNFSAQINGLINIASAVGNILGAIWGGWLTDVYSRWCARRNNGIFKPETRLVLLVLPTGLVPAGLLMFGFAAQEQLHWSVGFIGYAFIGFGLTTIANIGMTYILDVYSPIADEALLIVNALKNVFAFGFSYGVSPWVTQDGFEKTFGGLTGIFLAIMVPAIPLYLYGGRISHFTFHKWRLIGW